MMGMEWFRVWCVVMVMVIKDIIAFNVLWEEPQLLTPPGQNDIQFGFSLSHLYTGTQRQ